VVAVEVREEDGIDVRRLDALRLEVGDELAGVVRDRVRTEACVD
jgi:hypothetical protein